MYSHKSEPVTHVFDVELGNISKYLPLFGADFILGQILKSILPRVFLNYLTYRYSKRYHDSPFYVDVSNVANELYEYDVLLNH